MDRLKNSGFYKLQFFLSPEEFKGVLQLLEQGQARFRLSNYAQTEHDHDQVVEAYRTFYHYFTAAERRTDYHPLFVYSISVVIDQESGGFFAANKGVSFPYGGQWAADELPYIMLSLPKGVQINLEDEQGKYYVYEDIRDHKPLTYALFQELQAAIKKQTKPLRFSALDAAAMKEQKPSVRISPAAISDLSESWITRKYGLVLKGN